MRFFILIMVSLFATPLLAQSSSDRVNIAILGTGDASNIDWSTIITGYQIINLCEPQYAQFLTRQLTWDLDNRLAGRKPQYCALYAGIPDLLLGLPVDKIVKSYSETCDELKCREIVPIIIMPLPTTCHYVELNGRIDILRQALKSYASHNGICAIEAGRALTCKGFLRESYSSDGVMLNADGRCLFADGVSEGMNEPTAMPGKELAPLTTLFSLTRSGISNIISQSPRKVRIVMFGDSITEGGGDWNKRLGRDDVRNAGIGGYTSGQMLWHMDTTVLSPKPGLCVVMSGINDLFSDIPVDEITRNQITILEKLKRSGIKSVVISTLYRNGDKTMNANVARINKALSEYCGDNEIDWIDLNASLSDDNELKSNYTTDGTHLTDQAYEIWVDLLTEHLRKAKI